MITSLILLPSSQRLLAISVSPRWLGLSSLAKSAFFIPLVAI